MIGSRNLVSAAVNQPRPGILYAQVSTAKPAPSSFTDPLYVVFPQWHTDYYWRITDWPACHGTTLPAQGAEAVIVQDTAGVYRCVWWDGITSNPASLPPSGAAGGALSGTYPNPTLAPVVWHALPYNATNWQDYGVAGSGGGQYGLDAMGFVNLRGWLKSAAAYTFGAGSATIATLPAGFRPAGHEPFLVEQKDSATNINMIRADVDSSGNISLIEDATTATGVSNNGTATYLVIPSGTRFIQAN